MYVEENKMDRILSLCKQEDSANKILNSVDGAQWEIRLYRFLLN